MNNGYEKGVSKIEESFLKLDAWLKERNGNMSLSRNLIVTLDQAENKNFRQEQMMLFHEFLSSKIEEVLGPITERTVCEVDILPFERIYGDGKKVRISVTFRATVFKVKEKEVYSGKQLSFDC